MGNVVQGHKQYSCNSCGNIFEAKGQTAILDIFDIIKRKSLISNIFKARGIKCPNCKSKDITVLPIIY